MGIAIYLSLLRPLTFCSYVNILLNNLSTVMDQSEYMKGDIKDIIKWNVKHRTKAPCDSPCCDSLSNEDGGERAEREQCRVPVLWPFITDGCSAHHGIVRSRNSTPSLSSTSNPHADPAHWTFGVSLKSVPSCLFHSYHPGSNHCLCSSGQRQAPPNSSPSFPSGPETIYSHPEAKWSTFWKGNEFMPFPTLNSQWCPITLPMVPYHTENKIQNLHHRLWETTASGPGPIWPGFPLLFCIFTASQPLSCSCCCFNPANLFLPQGLCTTFLFWEAHPLEPHMTPFLSLLRPLKKGKSCKGPGARIGLLG